MSVPESRKFRVIVSPRLRVNDLLFRLPFPKKENKTLILDTLSTLMLYNNAETVGKFMHAVTGKLRNWGVKSVILTMEEETDKEIISQISQFVDKVVKI